MKRKNICITCIIRILEFESAENAESAAVSAFISVITTMHSLHSCTLHNAKVSKMPGGKCVVTATKEKIRQCKSARNAMGYPTNKNRLGGNKKRKSNIGARYLPSSSKGVSAPDGRL